MKTLNVRLDDAEHDRLSRRAKEAGMSVTALVKDWIGGPGEGRSGIPSVPAESGSSAASPLPEIADVRFAQVSYDGALLTLAISRFDERVCTGIGEGMREATEDLFKSALGVKTVNYAPAAAMRQFHDERGD